MDTLKNIINKLIISPISILVIGILIVGLNLFWFIPTKSSLRSSISEVEKFIVKAAVTQIEGFLEKNKNEVQIPANYISQDLGSKNNDLILKKILRGEDISSVSISDKDGTEVIKYDKYSTVTAKDLGSILDKEDFKQVIRTKEVSWSGVSFSDKSGPSITINIPLFSPAKDIVGVLSANFNIGSIFNTILNIGTKGDSQIYLVDEKGILVSGRDLSLVLKRTNYLGRKIVKDTLSYKNNIIVSSDDDEYSYENENGVKVLAVGAYVSEVKWVVIFEEPKNKAITDITKLTFFALISIAFIVSLLVFIRRIYLKVIFSEKEITRSFIEQKKLFEKSEILKKNLEEGNKNLIEKDRKIVEKVKELENFQKFVVDRELKMAELKKEIAELKSRLP